MNKDRTKADCRAEALKSSEAVANALSDYIIKVCKIKAPTGEEAPTIPEAVKAYNELIGRILSI